jgi:hypothetical protein
MAARSCRRSPACRLSTDPNIKAPERDKPRDETAFARKSEKAWIEADQVAVVLGDGRRQIVEPDFAAHAAEVLKSVDVTSRESFEGLAVRELEVHLAAVGFDQAEAIKLASGAVVDECAEVAPVHIAAFAGRGFDANISAAGHGVLPQGPQIIFDDGESAVENREV